MVSLRFSQAGALAVVGWVAGLAFAFWAVPNFRVEIASQELRELALQVSDGRAVPPEEIDRNIRQFRSLRPQIGCRSDLLRAGGTLMLAQASAVSQANPASQTSPALEEVELAFRDSLACAPWQANTWVVLAHLRAVSIGYDAEAQNLINVSYGLAPREAWIDRRRIALEVNSGIERSPAGEERLSSAIREMIEGPFWRDLVDMFLQSPVIGQRRILRGVETARDDARSRFHFHALWKK